MSLGCVGLWRISILLLQFLNRIGIFISRSCTPVVAWWELIELFLLCEFIGETLNGLNLCRSKFSSCIFPSTGISLFTTLVSWIVECFRKGFLLFSNMSACWILWIILVFVSLFRFDANLIFSLVSVVEHIFRNFLLLSECRVLIWWPYAWKYCCFFTLLCFVRYTFLGCFLPINGLFELYLLNG